jgi:hypothetical protein
MPRPLDLAVFVDALGWGIVEQYGFLEHLLPHRYPLESVLGYSCACIPTILTGCRPEEHGHFSFFRYAPRESPFGVFPRLDVLPSRVSEHGRFRNALSKVTQKVLGYTGYFQLYNVPFQYLPLFDYTEKKDLYTPGGINGGQETLFDALSKNGVEYVISDWRGKESVNAQAAMDAVDAGKARFIYLYLPGLDAILHAHGTGSQVVGERLTLYAGWIEELVALAKARGRELRIHVFSDHGMADISNHLDVMGLLKRQGLEFGTDYVAVFDSTMARFWFLREPAREKTRACLEDQPGGRVLTDADLGAFGCKFPDARYGEMFFLAHPGTLIHPSFMSVKPIAGMHGYEPAHAVSMATYMSSHVPAKVPHGLWDLKALLLDSLK